MSLASIIDTSSSDSLLLLFGFLRDGNFSKTSFVLSFKSTTSSCTAASSSSSSKTGITGICLAGAFPNLSEFYHCLLTEFDFGNEVCWTTFIIPNENSFRTPGI